MSRADDPNASKTPRNDNDREGSVLYGGTSDEIMQGHSYDGIQEYDNPMPGWWIWLLWATVAFAVFYVIGINVGLINNYEEDLAESLDELEQIRAAYAEEAGDEFEVTEVNIEENYVGIDEHIEAASENYARLCASCHGDQGQGGIGPNLTDQHFMHGGTNVDIYEVLTDGISGQGMPAFAAQLSSEERAQMVAFIRSIEGTDPPDARDPQGEFIERN